MCLAVPHRVVKIMDENRALVSTGGVELEVCTDLIEDLHVGDVVLVHAGFVIEKYNEDEGKELESLWEEVMQFASGR